MKSFYRLFRIAVLRNTLVTLAILFIPCLVSAMPDSKTDQTPVPPTTQPVVLDIENLRPVVVDRLPSDTTPTCDVLVIGGGLGGVAAAEAMAKRGLRVIITEPTHVLGGQLTSQLVPVPDENRYIEQEPGPSTRSYRELRESVRGYYEDRPDIVRGREKNIGSCWVSRVSGTPDIWERVINDRFDTLNDTNQRNGRKGNIRKYLRHQLVSITRFDTNGRINYADFVDLDTGQRIRIGAQFVLDATEDGDALEKAGTPTTIGQEAKAEYDEPHAPDLAHPEWIQSFAYCFVVRWQPEGPTVIVDKPAEYDYFKSLGEYTLDYVYSERGTVTYKMFEKAEGAGGSFWSYRRLVAASNFKGGTSPIGDLSLLNWRGNDFHEESPLGKPVDEQIRILRRGKEFALGFLYWLQTECPRDDGGFGYPEMQLVSSEEIPTIGNDGLGLQPYVRESRRLLSVFTLTEKHLTQEPTEPTLPFGRAFYDSVGCGFYAMDIHPSKGEPPLLVPALPFHLPLGSFLPRSGATNILPAAKNIGASRLALAAARMHPTEWLAGEIAGNLAAFCLERNIDEPSLVRESPSLLPAFQDQLRQSGITLYWSEILPPAPTAPAPPSNTPSPTK